MKYILYMITVFLSLKAQAEFKKANCTGIKPQHFSQVFLEAGSTCSTAEKIQKQLNIIKRFANIYAIPTLFVQKQSYESFGTFGGVIVLNQEQQAWDRVRPQEQNEKIWLHELGHVYFSHRLVEDFPAIQGFANYMKDAARLAVETSNPYTDDLPQLGSKWKPEFALARDIQAPYNELFADLVAVLAADDPLVMTKAMQSPGMPEKAKKETAYYGFAGKYDVKKWNESNPHFFFAPARAYIGQKYLKWPLDEGRKEMMLMKLYTTCMLEIKKHWAKNKKLPSSSEANQSLIKALE